MAAAAVAYVPQAHVLQACDMNPSDLPEAAISEIQLEEQADANPSQEDELVALGGLNEQHLVIPAALVSAAQVAYHGGLDEAPLASCLAQLASVEQVAHHGGLGEALLALSLIAQLDLVQALMEAELDAHSHDGAGDPDRAGAHKVVVHGALVKPEKLQNEVQAH